MTLGVVILSFAVVFFLPGLFHLGTADEFGERVANNLARLGWERRAKTWNRERGRRLSLLANRVYWILAALCVLVGGTIVLVGILAGES